MVTHTYAILSPNASANVPLRYVSGDWQCQLRNVTTTQYEDARGAVPNMAASYRSHTTVPNMAASYRSHTTVPNMAASYRSHTTESNRSVRLNRSNHWFDTSLFKTHGFTMNNSRVISNWLYSFPHTACCEKYVDKRYREGGAVPNLAASYRSHTTVPNHSVRLKRSNHWFDTSLFKTHGFC